MPLNTYNAALDPLAHKVTGAQFARLGLAPTKSDTVDLPTYVTLVVVVAGNIQFLPVINDAADPITITAAPVGYVIPWQVRRVFDTGTTAVLRTLEKTF